MHPFNVPAGFFEVLDAVTIIVFVYFIALQCVLFTLLFLSFRDMRRRLAQNFYTDYEAVAKSHFTFPVSVLISAHNEEKSVVEAARSVLSLDYPEHEVIVINDGSTDGTLAVLMREFQLERRESIVRRSIQDAGVAVR